MSTNSMRIEELRDLGYVGGLSNKRTHELEALLCEWRSTGAMHPLFRPVCAAAKPPVDLEAEIARLTSRVQMLEMEKTTKKPVSAAAKAAQAAVPAKAAKKAAPATAAAAPAKVQCSACTLEGVRCTKSVCAGNRKYCEIHGTGKSRGST